MNGAYSPLRTLGIAALAVVLGAIMAVVAQLLLRLIEGITALAFFGRFGLEESPADNALGVAVIFVPVVGGLLVGLMARWGSPAIRGHGIPEAMAQVLENASRIPARITWLKPLSAAISIGTGGPFGAEGPIIATGGAGGSLLGQLLPVSAMERKTLLAAGAAAGMAATFGSPLSALLLSVELLLFEFKTRSLIPVALAVGVATLLRVAWMGSAPVFPMPDLTAPSIPAFAGCLLIAGILGVAAWAISRAVYWVEDGFEKLPLHWMWWPALGAVAVGVIGYFEPRTLGVGYGNITANLAGSGTILAIGALCSLKFVSWSLSLGSGTSGGTLAPLMTVGSGLGWILGVVFQPWIPGLDPHLAALLGMACVFGGASQAMLASAVFAWETTGQNAALVPLLAGCAVAVWVVRALGRTSIMTEKIERRGVRVPSQYGVNVLEQTPVSAVMETSPGTISSSLPLAELERRISRREDDHQAHLLLDEHGALAGLITRGDVVRAIPSASPETRVLDCAATDLICVTPDETLHAALEKLLRHDIGRLPVVSPSDPKKLLGYLSRRAILSAHQRVFHEEAHPSGWPATI
jgi:CIC family chloride channel protein